MSTKDKPLSRLDVAPQQSPPAPSVNRVKFNPYTGSILKNDQPNFGKYNVFVSSGPKVISSFVKFAVRGSSTTYSIQIPMPQVFLNIRNPNFEIIDASLYLAIDPDEFDDIDEENDVGKITGKYVVQKIGLADSPILSNKTTMDLNGLFVKLFEKYTIQAFLEKLTGETVSNAISFNDAAALLYDNLDNLKIYAEAAFENSLENNTEYFFIKNKIVSNITFDRRYLDNPDISGFRVSFSGSTIKVNLDYKSLKSVKLSIYAGDNEDFIIGDDSFVLQKEFNALPVKVGTKMVNGASLMEIATSLLPVPPFNKATGFLTNEALNAIINSRKYVAVRVTSVTTTANIEITNPGTFFELNLTGKLTLPAGAPRPNHATPLTTASPYVLDLIRGRRQIHIYYNELGEPGDVALTVLPKDIKGIVIRYVNTPSTATNTTRFYPLSALTKIGGGYSTTLRVVTHYFQINDNFKLTSSPENTYKLNVPYAQTMQIYTVDNYYQVSLVPLTFTESGASPTMYKFNLLDYLKPALKVVNHILTFTKGFVKGKDKATFSFGLEVATSPTAVVNYANLNSLRWSNFRLLDGSQPTYQLGYTHGLVAIREDGEAIAALNDSKGVTVSAGLINTSNYKTNNTTYVFRAYLISSITGDLPYFNNVLTNKKLGVFVKAINSSGGILGT
jgi:hypothetical protein